MPLPSHQMARRSPPQPTMGGSVYFGSGPNAHEPGSVGGAESVSFDARGTRLLSVGYYDKTARLWDLTTDPPKPIREFEPAQAERLWAAQP